MTDATILKRLQKVESEVEEMKAKMADMDRIMAEEDYEALLDYRAQKAAGKLVSSEQARKAMGV